MLQINGEAFFTRQDLRNRYGYKDSTSINDCVAAEKLPWHDATYKKVNLWKMSSILSWEEKHGGNLNEFVKFLRRRTPKKSGSEIPPFMFAIVPPVTDGNDKDTNDEFKPVSRVVSQLLGDSHMSDSDLAALNSDKCDSIADREENNDLAASKPDKPEGNNGGKSTKPATVYYFENMYDNGELKPEAQKTGTTTRCNDDSDVEFFALHEKVIKLDGDIAELRANLKELIHVVMAYGVALNNSSGILYGRVKGVNEKLRKLQELNAINSNDTGTEEDNKLEGTDE